MKTVTLLLLWLAIIFIAGCEYEKQIPMQSHVQFTLGIVSVDEHTAADLPDNIIADITLASENGQSQFKNISFRKSGNDYISQSVEIGSGDYKIKEFLVLDADITGIPGTVDAFRVDQNKTSVFVGDVAAKLKHGQPLLIAVYVDQKGKKKLTDAMASLYTSEGEFYKSFRLSARTNHITFTGSLDSYYELIIEKEGHWPSSTYFVYDQLEKKRLEIVLLDSAIEPGPAITFQPSATVFDMRLQFMGTGSVVLDWRNGDPKETIAFDVDPENEAGTAFFSREMAYVVGVPPARITGDVHLLKGLYFDADANGLDARYATGLQVLALTGGEIDILDLSANNQLTSLRLTEMFHIENIILPQQHHISGLQISQTSGGNFPSESQTDYLIDNIYTNAVAQNILSGSITLSGINVSEQSASKLLKLQNDYGWSVAY